MIDALTIMQCIQQQMKSVKSNKHTDNL